MKEVAWISSGITEEIDTRQQRLLDEVLAQIRRYYHDLYLTLPKYVSPLTLSMLSRMCNRSNVVVMAAVRMLANTVEISSSRNPPIHYQRIKSGRNASHRPYQIFLR